MRDLWLFIQQVAPAELEAVLSSHPKVKDVGVIGIDDEIAGQLPRAYIVKKDPTLTKEEIMNYTSGKLNKSLETPSISLLQRQIPQPGCIIKFRNLIK